MWQKGIAKLWVLLMRMVEWPDCQTKPLQGLAMLPSLVMTLGMIAPRLYSVVFGQDMTQRKPHMHLDPLNVAPEHQGNRIGSLLLQHFCDITDEKRLPGYLETDQERNVQLYNRFGFKIVEEAPIFGVTTWLMWRKERIDF